jgi:hypothetical protein
MTLLDEIIDAAVDEKVPIGTLLRKCLVLQQQVKNEKFRAWLDRELDGYDQMERRIGNSSRRLISSSPRLPMSTGPSRALTQPFLGILL